LLHTTYTCAFKPGCLMSHNWLHTPDCKVLNEKKNDYTPLSVAVTPCLSSQTAPSVCTASIASQAIKMDVLVYNRTKEYLPDVQDQSWSLGKGGCFTTVER